MILKAILHLLFFISNSVLARPQRKYSSLKACQKNPLKLYNLFCSNQDGACYVIFPDCPLIEYPINQTLEFIGVVLIAKRIASHFGVELFTYKHLLAILLIMFISAYHLFLFFLSWIF